MKLELISATLADYPIIQNMGRFYVYDMSEYMGSEAGWEMPSDGLYECIDFQHYWTDQDTFPFLVRANDELAGFVIVNKFCVNLKIKALANKLHPSALHVFLEYGK
jgi:hypothetical protein